MLCMAIAGWTGFTAFMCSLGTTANQTQLTFCSLLQLPSWKHRLCFRHPGHLPCVSVLVSQMFACWHCPAELAVDVLVDAPHEPCRRCKANYTYSTARGRCVEDCGVGAQAQYPATYDLVRSPGSILARLLSWHHFVCPNV